MSRYRRRRCPEPAARLGTLALALLVTEFMLFGLRRVFALVGHRRISKKVFCSCLEDSVMSRGVRVEGAMRRKIFSGRCVW
jgi:hypothetical protein